MRFPRTSSPDSTQVGRLFRRQKSEYQGLTIPPECCRSFRCVCDSETGCKPVQKRSRPLNFTWTASIAPPGGKTLRRKNHHGAGTEGCSKWRCHDELKSRQIKTKIIQLLAFLDDERGKHDHERKSQETCTLKAVRRFSATLTCA